MTGHMLVVKIRFKKRSEFPLSYDDAVMFLTAKLAKNSVKVVISGSVVNLTLLDRCKFRNLE